MTKLTKVHLRGFKGLHGTYMLDGPTVLTGPNGAGKSACLEGIVYALTGGVPGGRNLDSVAQYFEVRGGTVTVEDSDGRWIRRGVTRDAGKAKVSEVLESSETGPEDKAARVEAWAAVATVLDIKEFLGKSTEKRREFILALCGAGETPATEILDTLATQYAREVAGPAATVETLERPEDLPPDVLAMAREWGELKSLAEAVLQPGVSATKNFQKLSKTIKDERLGARRAGLDAKSALRELETTIAGARAAASELKTVELVAAQAQSHHTAVAAQAAQGAEARRNLAHCEMAIDTACDVYADAKAKLSETPAPSGQPTPPNRRQAVDDIATLVEKVQQLHEKDCQLQEPIEKGIEAARARRIKAGELSVARESLKHHREGDSAPLLACMSQIPDTCHPKILELRKIVVRMTTAWRTEERRCQGAVEGLEDQLGTLDEEREHIDAMARDAATEKEKVKAEALVLSDAIKTARKAMDTLLAEYEQRLLAWQNATSAHTRATNGVTSANDAVGVARAALEDAQERVAAAGDFSQKEVDDVETALYGAQERLRVATEAAGVVRTYEEAAEYARSKEVFEKACKAFEKALHTAREALVGQSTRGLLGDLTAVLANAGRSEVPYLKLENERGRAVFELGWTDNGATVALPALSGGQAALFCSALAYALIRRATGRRVLLVEADPVDDENLLGLLKGLGPCDDLEALVVATAKYVDDTPGWAVVKVQQ